MSTMPAEDPSLPIDSEAVSMTVQAEIEHMTQDEAIASGLFDSPDEPGMVRIPVTIHVAVTPELAAAIERAETGAAPE